MRKVFARIWALWGLLSFIATFFIFFLPAMCSHLIADPKKSQHFFIKVSRVWMSVWLPLIGCRVTIRGKENFRKGEVYIVVFNHNTLLDVPLSAPFVPGPNKTIAKASFTKVPIFGWFYQKGSVLVDRKNDESRARSFDAMKAVLAADIHMSIYPEGTRNRTNEPLKKFYDGAFKLAAITKTAVLPCIIRGTKEAMPVKETFYLLPKKLSMEFLPPVSSENKSAEVLKNEVYNIMLNGVKNP